MAELAIAGLFVTPVVETLVNGLINFLKDEALSIYKVKKELEGMKSMLGDIMLIIKYAGKQSLDDEGIHLWMTDLKDITYDIDDIINDCKVKVQSLTPTSSKSTIVGSSHLATFSRLKNLKFSRKIGKRIKEINAKLEEIVKEKSQLRDIAASFEDQQQLKNEEIITKKTTHFVTSDLVGCIKEDAEKLMKFMLYDNESGGRNYVNLAILGMGGIGKTTLAQQIFDIVTQDKQFHQKLWICVSKDFNVEDVIKEIVRQADGSYGMGESLNELVVALEKVVRNKKFFLILDDVWNANIWDVVLKDPLKSGADGSKILITTRDVNIAKQIAFHNYEVKLLSREEGWFLLRNNVFQTKEERNTSGYLMDIGIKIVEKCGQLPLSIKSIAGILKTKDKRISEWEKIISNEVWTKNIFKDDVMKPLYLSYEDLPYQLKQCFVYCSLFPEDYTFNKTYLVGMWIAEGFLGDKATLESGESLLEELENRYLLQRDGYANRHKLHDLLRSLGQILSNGEYFFGNLKNLDKSVRRLSLRDENSLANYYPQRLHKNLRTLMFFSSSDLKVVSKSVFQKLHYLRVLSLSGTGIYAIPDSIKFLLHLRYLDLSNSKIKFISESICYLQSLQFLLLIRCELLEKLPNGITSLQNLVLLELSSSTTVQMPKGMQQLKQLRSLVFRVAENENNAKLGCTMHELQSMNLLTNLCILNLQKNLSLKEVRSVELVKKNHLQNLTLHWKPIEDASDEDINKVTKVIEELRPPSSLLYLFIYDFYGHNLPNWMSYSNGISLNNLMQLEIKGCPHCQHLPGFGKLPQLEVLRIYEASSIQKIGPEFLGRGDRSASTYFCPFAKLESMRLEDFSKLEEWHWDGAEDDEDGGTAPFPCLKYLFIEKCPKLKSLPDGLRHATFLVQLDLDGNKNLMRIPGLPTLKDLFITNCSSIQHVGNLNSLEYVGLVDMKLSVIPLWLSSLVASKTLSSMSSLQKLSIGTGELQLLRRLCPWDIGLDWPLIKDIPLLYANLVGQDHKAGSNWNSNALDSNHCVAYFKSPFSIAADLPNTGLIGFNNSRLISRIYRMKFATTAQAEVLDITSTTANQLWDIKLAKKVVEKNVAKYYKLPSGLHAHVNITTANGRTRMTCICQSYFDDPAFVPFHPFSHTHLPYKTNQGETGMACLHLKHVHPKGPGSQVSSSTS